MMAFSAFEDVAPLPAVAGGAACAAVGEDAIYVGTADGVLVRYHAAPTCAALSMASAAGAPEAASADAIQWMVGRRQPLGIGRRMVEQLELLPSIGMLLVLADGAVFLHDASTLERRGHLDGAKGAGAMCVSAALSGAAYRVCVALHRGKPLRLALYEVAGSPASAGPPQPQRRPPQQAHTPYKVLLTPEPALALEWGAEQVCVGYASEYALVHDSSGDVVELLGREREAPPRLLQLARAEEVLVLTGTAGPPGPPGLSDTAGAGPAGPGAGGTGAIGTFVSLRTADAAARSPLTWAEAPLALAQSAQFLLSLLRSSVAVHLLGDGGRPHVLVQTVPLTPTPAPAPSAGPRAPGEAAAAGRRFSSSGLGSSLLAVATGSASSSSAGAGAHPPPCLAVGTLRAPKAGGSTAAAAGGRPEGCVPLVVVCARGGLRALRQTALAEQVRAAAAAVAAVRAVVA